MHLIPRSHSKTLPQKYTIVLDAGSSGTRAHIFHYDDPVSVRATGDSKALRSPPAIKTKKKWTKKIKPGLSSFAKDPGAVGSKHLKPLLKHALDIIPPQHVADTPVYVHATAGMRLLPENEQRAILSNTCSYIREVTNFYLPDCARFVQIIDGKTEALYGWLATNYLLGSFDTVPADHWISESHTFGFLDMGGASAQIAFAPNQTEARKHADDLTLVRMRTVDGRPLEHRVFTTSWLGYGVNQARMRYLDTLAKDIGDPEATFQDRLSLIDPCMPKGMNDTVALPTATKNETSAIHLTGSGQFDECVQRTFPLLEKDAPCPDAPCLVHGVHTPAIDFNVNHFIGISEWWFTTHEFLKMASNEDKPYNSTTYQEAVKNFCSISWDEIEEGVNEHAWGKKLDTDAAKEICFKASWLINLLHDGIGVPRIEELEKQRNSALMALAKDSMSQGNTSTVTNVDAFQALDKIHSTELSWTLGKALLVSSSEVPPPAAKTSGQSNTHDAASNLPVGFGSNIYNDIPSDFQYPGLPPSLPPSSLSHPFSLSAPYPFTHNITGKISSYTSKWEDAVFTGESPRRIPGFILAILIIGTLCWFMWQRQRRPIRRYYRKMSDAFMAMESRV